MERLVDADELIEVAHRIRLDSRERIEQMIESAPTVDAIKVVRCKDCKYYEETDSRIGTCLLTISGAEVDGFCAWAERKEDVFN